MENNNGLNKTTMENYKRLKKKPMENNNGLNKRTMGINIAKVMVKDSWGNVMRLEGPSVLQW